MMLYNLRPIETKEVFSPEMVISCSRWSIRGTARKGKVSTLDSVKPRGICGEEGLFL